MIVPTEMLLSWRRYQGGEPDTALIDRGMLRMVATELLQLRELLHRVEDCPSLFHEEWWATYRAALPAAMEIAVAGGTTQDYSRIAHRLAAEQANAAHGELPK